MKWYLKLWIVIARVLSWGYRIILNSFFTVVFNAYHLLKIIFTGKFFAIQREKKEIKSEITSITKLIYEYRNFRYLHDGLYNKVGTQTLLSKWPTWVPLITVFIYRDKHGNCEDASAYAQWLFRALKKNSVEAKKRFSGQVEVMVPYTFPEMLLGPHYIYVLRRKGEVDKTLPNVILSNGKSTLERKEDLAKRFVGSDKYFWM